MQRILRGNRVFAVEITGQMPAQFARILACAIDQGRFGNIRNNPVVQEVSFKAVSARYFRFTAVREVGGKNAASVAELTVLPAPKTGE